MTVLEPDAIPASPVVELEHTDPVPQRRWTIALRLILVIPHWIWLSLIGIAVEFALIGAWLAALFTGRVPDGLHTFLSRWAKYQTRVYAYLALLTDEYPSFELDAEGYPFELQLPPSGRLNRAAVLFRAVLVMPAAFVAMLAFYGLAVCSFFFWLIALVKGRLPRTIHDALTATLRYGSRLTAYFALLTSEYPHRLFGDKVAPAPIAAEEPADLDLAAAPPPTGAPLATPPVRRSTLLVLAKGAKRLLALSMALVVVLFVGLMVVGIAVGTQGDKAADRIEAQYELLSEDIQTFSGRVQTCGFGGGPECMNRADQDLAAALEDFRAELRDTSYPRNSLGLAHELEDDTDDLIGLLHARADARTVAQYQVFAQRFVKVGQEFDQDYAQLIFELRGGVE